MSHSTVQVDVLAFGAHPDDVELSAGGTLAKLAAEGKSCAIVDLTRGELGTRGSAEIRAGEIRRPLPHAAGRLWRVKTVDDFVDFGL